jgi:hypothetical protein
MGGTERIRAVESRDRKDDRNREGKNKKTETESQDGDTGNKKEYRKREWK